MSTAETGRVPFIPEIVLRAYNVYERGDDRYRAAVRARQALLRQERGWPSGLWTSDKREPREVGSYLSEHNNDANFITPEVAKLVRREVAWREDGALIDTDRLYRNMISSAPATFNLLGPLALDLRLASAIMRRLAPDFSKRVTTIQFEHSPARRDPCATNDKSGSFTNDRSAFDALAKVDTLNGENGFIAFEVKLTESLAEQPSRLRPRYDEVSRESELFIDPDHPALRAAPLNQLWRQHCLAAKMVQNGLYTAGRFVVIAPSLNRVAQQAIELYRTHLLPGGIIPFEVVTYEALIKAISRSGAREIANLLYERYLDFSSVDELITG